MDESHDPSPLDEVGHEEHPSPNEPGQDVQAEYERRYREQLSRMSCFGCGEEPL
jgi:hypothetical protein